MKPLNIPQPHRSALALLTMLVLFAGVLSSCKQNAPTAPNPSIDSSKLNITGFSPQVVVVGETVTIYGTQFGTVADSIQVFLDTVRARIIQASADSLRIIIPQLAVGSYSIRAVKLAQTATSRGQLIISARPFIGAIFPQAGPVGTVVQLEIPSSSTARVFFNGLEAQVMTDMWAPYARVRVPIGAKSGFVTLSDGGERAVDSLWFTVIQQNSNYLFTRMSFSLSGLIGDTRIQRYSPDWDTIYTEDTLGIQLSGYKSPYQSAPWINSGDSVRFTYTNVSPFEYPPDPATIITGWAVLDSTSHRVRELRVGYSFQYYEGNTQRSEFKSIVAHDLPASSFSDSTLEVHLNGAQLFTNIDSAWYDVYSVQGGNVYGTHVVLLAKRGLTQNAGLDLKLER